jgi:hypothetical protein
MPDDYPEMAAGRSKQPGGLFQPVVAFALWCVGAFFAATAFYGFVTGFWRLLIFFGGISYYGMPAVEMDTFGEQLGRATAALFGPVLFGTIAGVCFTAARRLNAWRALARRTENFRAPVVYLRSFTTDKHLSRRPRAIGRLLSTRTEEEQLVEALRDMGPVVAIGRPGERLPRLGATRIYIEDADWQQQVLSWFERAALVVIHVPPFPTQGVVWEIERSLSHVPLSRLTFLISRESNGMEWLAGKIQEHGLTISNPQKLPRGPYRAVSSGLVYFSSDRHAELSPLLKPPFFRRPFSQPLVPAYRLALKPVTMRATGFWQPLPLGFGDALIAAVWVTFLAVVVVSGVYFLRTELVARETTLLGRDLIAQLPADALQLVQNRDEVALAAWIQSHYQMGIRYVPDDAVTAQAGIVQRLLTAAPPAACAALANGTATHATSRPLLNELGMADQDAFRAFFAFRKKALTESLASRHAAAFPLTDGDVLAGFVRVLEGLSTADQGRFHRVSAAYDSASPEDQCWYARALFERIERLDEPYRSKVARMALGQPVDR